MNPRIAEVAPSLIRELNARKRPGDIDLGLGEPTLPPDLAAFGAALEWTRRHGSPYTPNAGFPELREAVARYLEAPGAWASGPLTAERVCITVGSQEALYLAIKTVVDPARHEVLVPEPCFLAYPKICTLEGIRCRTVPFDPADDFRPSAERVLAALGPDTRLVVLNSPTNPTGRVWPEEELAALARGLAAHRTRDGEPVFVLSDEVYRELYYGPSPPDSIARHYPHALVAGSLSKSNALTGLRLGWLAGPKDVVARAIKVHQFVDVAASTFAQRVAIALFAEPGALSAHRAHYVAARERLLEAAGDAGVTLIPPEGTFYALVRLPEALRHDSLGVAFALLETERVITVPGRAFGDAAEGWLRLSWVAPPDVLAEGLGRIGAWLREHG